MPEKITSFKLSKREASRMIFSPKTLYDTRNDSDGPMQTIISWMKLEIGGRFDISNMRVGSNNSSYSVLYYHSGMLYVVDKNGRARVSGADADILYTYVEKDMQRMLDGIISVEISKMIMQAVERNGINVGKSKQVRGSDKELLPRVLVGIKD